MPSHYPRFGSKSDNAGSVTPYKLRLVVRCHKSVLMYKKAKNRERLWCRRKRNGAERKNH
ncbi:hypothetical protein PILCRDRAFT_815778 [Piloderma croceum F 1598]|uniref:Uncharacterized protein n=1 Tax=Piloderma croceum (strain F 1598) TaxID=765440 RepID=A0A0C3C9Z1_PILCF|nr:hypothetical protein PILCRDRAFT_815778 [Piloderma croceum F 1598]